ncbi:transcriptional regulator [Bacillus pseudomycoides]|nr:transcriptional regulator [Bacillus pseudomycoides]
MMKNNMNILFTSSGRRVALIKKFKEAFEQEKMNGNIITADLKETAPTVYFSDKHFIVPRVTEENYVEELLQICQKENISLIIPLIDTELILLAENKPIFEEIGVKVLVSSKELNEIANNKVNTYNFFISHNILTPKVYSDEEIHRKKYQFPVLIKPRDGSSSKGVTKIKNEKELNFFKDYIPNAMIQEYVSGEEYTVDVMVDFDGNIKTIVPRLRIETRAGEVSKGVTKKDHKIIKAVENVVKNLPAPVGCITLQCFKKADGEITFIEINPRFGGGIPLSIEAGANFPLWTIKMCQGEVFAEKDFSWKENLMMLRYDEAVFTESIQYGN